jgi:hypothetical protein
MPNHVTQDLIVSGKLVDIEAFKDFASSEEEILAHNKFIPYPFDKEVDDATAYDWCLEHWGTKAGIYDSVLLQDHPTGDRGKLLYTFLSAWSSANKIVFAMSTKFPTLRFRLDYWEGGMGFKGTYTVKGGRVIKDVTSEYRGKKGG